MRNFHATVARSELGYANLIKKCNRGHQKQTDSEQNGRFGRVWEWETKGEVIPGLSVLDGCAPCDKLYAD